MKGLKAILIFILQLTICTAGPAYLVVYVQPQTGYTIYANCWSNSTNSPATFSQNFTANGEFSWKMPYNSYGQAYDACWCRALMGNNILTQFPIYGGGLPLNSSEWLINFTGKRRISLESDTVNDNRAIWVNYTTK